MPHPDSCPPAADYEAMLQGRLGDDRAATLEAHLDGCAACQQLLDRLAVGPRLTDALRGRPATADPAPELAAMISRIEDMASQFTPAGFDLSASADGDDTPPEPPQDPGDVGPLGVYRVVRLLGAGGMGLVYLAEDEVLHRRVAVKVLRPRLARKTRARDGFLREARAMAALKHDNVVTVFQVGEAAGPKGEPVPFLAMELLEGESLADWLRREGPVPPAWAARIGRQAADGLAAAHARGVVHRDIKPGNLWLEAPPAWADLPPADRPPLPAAARVKVLDFGLAQPAGEEAGEGGPVGGTPAYMAPEQAAGRDVDHRADLFSLGVVLYEMVAGRLPFPREGRKPTDPPPTPVGELVPGVPPPVADLIARLLAPDPAGRPASAAEVKAALAPFVPLAQSGVSRIPPALSVAPVPPPRRRRWVAAAAAVLGLALAGVGVWLATRPGGTAGPLPGPPDPAWAGAVAGLPADRQVAAVVAKLRELNPDYDGQVARLGFEEGTVTELVISTDEITDVRPVRALTGLKQLSLIGSVPGKGKLTDLSPIRGLGLVVLNVWQNPNLSDLSPARGMPITLFQAGDTAIEDISPLSGMPLGTISVNNCRVKDLTPVRSMPRIRFIRCDGCPITSLEPLVGTKVEELVFDFKPERGDGDVLKRLTGLRTINRRPANEFRALHGVAK